MKILVFFCNVRKIGIENNSKIYNTYEPIVYNEIVSEIHVLSHLYFYISLLGSQIRTIFLRILNTDINGKYVAIVHFYHLLQLLILCCHTFCLISWTILNRFSWLRCEFMFIPPIAWLNPNWNDCGIPPCIPTIESI